MNPIRLAHFYCHYLLALPRRGLLDPQTGEQQLQALMQWQLPLMSEAQYCHHR